MLVKALKYNIQLDENIWLIYYVEFYFKKLYCKLENIIFFHL